MTYFIFGFMSGICLVLLLNLVASRWLDNYFGDEK